MADPAASRPLYPKNTTPSARCGILWGRRALRLPVPRPTRPRSALSCPSVFVRGSWSLGMSLVSLLTFPSPSAIMCSVGRRLRGAEHMPTRDQAAETPYPLRGFPAVESPRNQGLLLVAPLCGVMRPPTLCGDSFLRFADDAGEDERGAFEEASHRGAMRRGRGRPAVLLSSALYPSAAARIVGHLTSRDWQEIQARPSLALAVR